MPFNNSIFSKNKRGREKTSLYNLNKTYKKKLKMKTKNSKKEKEKKKKNSDTE